MNEIVWAMNLSNDNLQSLISYTREYAVTYMDDFNIDCKIELPDQIPDLPVIGTRRRDIFLLVKESLNNIVKHAQATETTIKIRIDKNLEFEIADNGKGFDMLNIRKNSNGLLNMRSRIEKLQGRIQFKQDTGTLIIFEVPLKKLSDTEIET
jgi:signal transduction histidine kinase